MLFWLHSNRLLLSFSPFSPFSRFRRFRQLSFSSFSRRWGVRENREPCQIQALCFHGFRRFRVFAWPAPASPGAETHVSYAQQNCGSWTFLDSLLLVVRPGATSSDDLQPNSDGLHLVASLLLVVWMLSYSFWSVLSLVLWTLYFSSLRLYLFSGSFLAHRGNSSTMRITMRR